MMIAWTTVSSRPEANRLARGAVEKDLATCAQIDSEIISYYRWEGKLEEGHEFRVWFKYMPANASALQTWVMATHTYETPQWIEISAENVGQKYLSWAVANFTSASFRNSQ